MNREKVVKGLGCCSSMNGYACAECPYSSECVSGEVEYQVGTAHLASDALSLLKEQEPLAVKECKVNTCVCGNEINRYWHPEYCGFCGKKLVWY